MTVKKFLLENTEENTCLFLVGTNKKENETIFRENQHNNAIFFHLSSFSSGYGILILEEKGGIGNRGGNRGGDRGGNRGGDRDGDRSGEKGGIERNLSSLVRECCTIMKEVSKKRFSLYIDYTDIRNVSYLGDGVVTYKSRKKVSKMSV